MIEPFSERFTSSCTQFTGHRHNSLMIAIGRKERVEFYRQQRQNKECTRKKTELIRQSTTKTTRLPSFCQYLTTYHRRIFH